MVNLKKIHLFITFVGLMACSVHAAPATVEKPVTHIQKVMTYKPKNAEHLLALLGDTLEQMVEAEETTERVSDIRPFLQWLVELISTKKSDDTIISWVPYFNRSNIHQLKLIVDAYHQYFQNRFINNALVGQEFGSFKVMIENKRPMGFLQVEIPSMIERGIFRANIQNFRNDIWRSRQTLTFATHARDVLGNIADLYEELCGSLARTYVEFENFGHAQDQATKNFVTQHTEKMYGTVQAWLDKLSKNVSIDEGASSWWSKTPYFDRANFALLEKLLLLIEDFLINKAAMNETRTIKMFDAFFIKYGVTPHHDHKIE